MPPGSTRDKENTTESNRTLILPLTCHTYFQIFLNGTLCHVPDQYTSLETSQRVYFQKDNLIAIAPIIDSKKIRKIFQGQLWIKYLSSENLAHGHHHQKK